jgi:hypothetical protein
MSTESNPERSKNSAGLAGAGSGTLVSVVANQLPDTNVLKVPLLYCAPSLSIVIALVLVWVQVRIVSYFREKEVKNLVEITRREIKKSLEDQSISKEHRDQLQKELEDLNMLSVQRLKTRLQSLEVVTVEDISKAPRQNENPA